MSRPANHSRSGLLRRRGWLLAVALAALALIAWAWWGGGATAERYRTAAVERGGIRVAISATGTLRALSTVDVGSQVSGLVKSVEVDFNDRVKKDQAIAHLDPQPIQLRLQQAQATLASARASRLQAQAALANAERDYARKRELGARQLVARSDADLALSTRDQARAQVAALDAQIQQSQAAVESAQLDLDYAVIKSPVDGVVLSRTVEPGQTVAASFQTPVLFQIAEDLGQMQIELSVDEADVGQIVKDQTVRFSVDAFAERQFSGRVEQVRLAATQASNVVTYPVVVRVDNTDLTLLPGMTANAEIEVSRRDDVLKVPNAALRYRPTDTETTASPTAVRGGGALASELPRLAGTLTLDERQRAAFDEGLAAMRERQAQRRRAADAAVAEASQTASRPGMFGRMRGGPGGGPNGGAPDAATQAQIRERMLDGMTQTFAAFRATLSSAQQQRLDAGLRTLASARRAPLYKLVDGKPQALTARIGVTDGTSTDVSGDGLAEGDAVIVGVETPAE